MSIRISLQIDPVDLQVVAEWLNAQGARECTSAQHDAIAQGILTRAVCQAAITGDIPHTPEVRAVFERDYAAFGRATRRPRLLPIRRTSHQATPHKHAKGRSA